MKLRAPVRLPSARPRGARHRRRREAGPRPAAVDEKILVTQGTGFNWPPRPSLRIVTLPWARDLANAIERLGNFLAGYASSRGGALAFAQQRRGATGSSGGADRRRRPVPHHRTRHHRRRCPCCGPRGRKSKSCCHFQNARAARYPPRAGHVVSSTLGDCGSPSVGQVPTAPPAAGVAGSGPRIESVVAIDSGPKYRRQHTAGIPRDRVNRTLLAGEQVRIFRQVDGQGATTHGFYDYERTWPLLLLAVAFAVVIVAVARWRGLRAMDRHRHRVRGSAVFMLPALRDGAPAIPVSLVAASAILFAVIYLAHGVTSAPRCTAGHHDRDAAGSIAVLGGNRTPRT